MLIDTSLTLLNLTPNSLPETHLQIQAASQKAALLLLLWSTLYTAFL